MTGVREGNYRSRRKKIRAFIDDPLPRMQDISWGQFQLIRELPGVVADYNDFGTTLLYANYVGPGRLVAICTRLNTTRARIA
jgi:hypothetical protein